MRPSLRLRRGWLVAAAAALAAAATLLLAFSNSAEPTSPPVEQGSASHPKTLIVPERGPAIVFSGNRSGGYELYAIDPGGGRPVRLSKELGMYPTFSEDGQRLAFVGQATGSSETRLVLLLADHQGRVSEVSQGSQLPSHPSFDSRRDAIYYQSTLQAAEHNSGVSSESTVDVASLADGPRRTVVENGGAAFQPAVSPNGRQVAVVLGDPACANGKACRQELVLVDPNGRKLTTLIGTGAAGAPAWAPSGRELVFTWDRGHGPRVTILDLASSRTRALADSTSGDSEPVFSPDGKQVAFSRACDIYVEQVAGGRARNLTESKKTCEISPTWRP